MLAPFLHYYFLANLLLLFSLLFFVCARRAFAAVNVRVAHQPLVRCGQALMLLSVLAPLFLSAIPDTTLPGLKMPAFFLGADATAGPAGRSSRVKTEFRAEAKPVSAHPDRLAHLGMQLHNFGSQHWLNFAAALWAIGFAFSLWRLGRNFARLYRLLNGTVTLKRLGRIRVGVSSALAVPVSAFVPGTRWVLLPEGMLGQRGDVRLALKHEFQHQRQGDTQWALVVEALLCVFYPNFAAYLWKRQITELQEFSCDEIVVGQRGVSSREYGSCLVRVAETALGCREIYVGTTYMATASRNPKYFNSFLSRRIEMLATKIRPNHGKWPGRCIGTLGVMVTLSFAYGVERTARDLNADLPNPGTIVVDKEIQKITQKILADSIAVQDASEGFAIVAEPQSGRILAVANFDEAEKKKGFWALSERMEPASTMKSLVVAEALEEGKTTPTEEQHCENGSYRIGGRVFHDWKDTGFGKLTTTQTIAQSSDICTVKIAEKISEGEMRKLLPKYGFGPNGTAQSFPGSRPGQLPPEEGSLAGYLIPFVAFGQGFRSTPLELVQAYGAIANGGNLLMPLPASASEGDRKVVRRVLSVENAEKMKSILREVVLSGTARRNATSYLYTTAGKTGTSYTPDESWLEESRGTRKGNTGSFIGFAPVANPRVVVYVVIRNPKLNSDGDSGAHGARHAAPVFRQIAEAVLQRMKVAPDNF